MLGSTMPATRALITGITGQDGSYLAEHLLEKGHDVHGIIRRTSLDSTARLEAILPRITLHQADLLDVPSLLHVLRRVEPDQVYNLAAQSFVPASFAEPLFTSDVTGLGVARVIEAIRLADPERRIRFYQASSSEMFGRATETPQSERTAFHPASPYGIAKVYGHLVTTFARECYGMHASSGILFNHTSPRRAREFVTRKITLGAARIKLGLASELRLGNLDARRDWGFAGDYVRAMVLMVERPEPGDFVVASGRARSVREVLDVAFGRADLGDWGRYIVLDPALRRPRDVEHLVGDATRARTVLGWEQRVPVEKLFELMVESDLALVERERTGPLRLP